MRFQLFRLVASACAAASLVACTTESPEQKPPAPPPTPEPTLFADITAASGVKFVHTNAGTGKFYMPEIMGSGVALVDIDNDGDLDIYLLQGTAIGQPDSQTSDLLFRNDLNSTANSSASLAFTDITQNAGIPTGGYGMGVATGDINGDGWTDLYITNFGSNRMLKNQGGSFIDVTDEAMLDDPRWSIPATFFDLEGDGDQDLYVGNYVEFRIANHKDCKSTTGLPDYCSPHSYNATTDRLFVNRGNGVFDDASVTSGIRQVSSKALGVITADFNNDSLIDLYVANDGEANQLWINQGNGTFRDDALLAGSALNFKGIPEASMGVDAADVDADGDEDVFITHLRGETNTIYLNRGDGTFDDRTIRLGLANASMPFTGFGTAWVDVQNDGRLDLFSANGAVTREEQLAQAGSLFPYAQRNQLFLNMSDSETLQFEEHRDTLFSNSVEVSRGAAFGDLDNDGDTDIVINNNNGQARILINKVGQNSTWLGLKLLFREGGSDALGAVAKVRLSDNRILSDRVKSNGSYGSANDPRILFGLGDSAVQEQTAHIVWPDGTQEYFGPLAVRRYHSLIKGNGKVIEPTP